MKKNKLFTSLFGAAVTSIILVGCNSLKTNGTLTAQNKENIEALTSITFLESITNSHPHSLMRRKLLNESVSIYDETQLDSILPTLDTIMNNGTAVKSTVEEVETIIDGTTYYFKETLSFKDHSLKDSNYILIYNKEIGKEKVDDDKDEVQTSETLHGYVVINDFNYPFESKSSVEKEDDEIEEERYFYISVDEGSNVLVEEENESEINETEAEFSYLYVKNGKTEIEYSISIENKNNRFDEISYELNGIEYELKKIKVDGEELYKIEIENNKDEEAVVYYKKEVAEDGTVSFVKVVK